MQNSLVCLDVITVEKTLKKKKKKYRMQFTYEEFHYKMTLLLKCDTCFKIIASVKVRLTRDSFFFKTFACKVVTDYVKYVMASFTHQYFSLLVNETLHMMNIRFIFISLDRISPRVFACKLILTL